VGEVGTVEENICPRCSTVGVKRPLARSVVGVKTSSCGDDNGPVTVWMAPEGSDEALKASGGGVSLGRRDREDTRESFSSGEGKRDG